MAKTDLEQLVVQLDAKYTKFQNAMLKAQGISNQSAGRIEKRFKDMNSSVSTSLSVFKSFGAGLIGGLGVEQLARAAASAIKSIADIGDAATKLGLSNSEFQTLGFAAQLAGVEVDALAGGMKKLGINSSDAVHGQGEFGDILKANNISLTDGNGKMKSQIEILGIVANLVANAATEQDGLAIAQAALGKSGTELMGLLQQGAAGVASAMGQASAAGVQFTDAQIAKAQEFDDKIDTLIKTVSFGLKDAFLDIAVTGVNAFDGINAEIIRLTNGAANLDDILSGLSKYSIGGNIKPDDGLLSLSFDGKKVFGIGGQGDAGVKPDIPRAVSGAGKTDRLDIKPTVLPTKPLAAVRDTAALAASRKANAERDRLERESASRQKQLERERVQATRDAERERTDIWQQSYDFEFAKTEEAQANYIEAQNAKRDSLLALAEMGYSAFESVVTGSLKAKDAVKQLALQIAQAVAQAALFGQGPLSGLFGGGKSGGFFGSLIGGLLGGGKTPVSLYHSGGIAGQSSGMSRSVNPGVFAGAPRYHNGGVAGLKPNEVPAILQKGERIIPNGASSSGGSGGTIVQLTQHFHGVAGNSEIHRIAKQATSEGIRDYSRKAPEIDLERRLRA